MKVTQCYHCGKELKEPVEHDFYDVFCSPKCKRVYDRMNETPRTSW
jgi:ribosomal protein L24E